MGRSKGQRSRLSPKTIRGSSRGNQEAQGGSRSTNLGNARAETPGGRTGTGSGQLPPNKPTPPSPSVVDVSPSPAVPRRTTAKRTPTVVDGSTVPYGQGLSAAGVIGLLGQGQPGSATPRRGLFGAPEAGPSGIARKRGALQPVKIMEDSSEDVR